MIRIRLQGVLYQNHEKKNLRSLRADGENPAKDPKGPKKTMGIMVDSLLWVMQDFLHEPYW